ncbi:MAG: hypothetical protein CL840_05485 [Crocinitomicaceae bacterium]|nr:hypothetical protein [Crocinitomicaceae bacterium]|tara:strand:+ start:8700 stop:9650 length:951 start_codon:yes stop_codon:yes gene_type:complete
MKKLTLLSSLFIMVTAIAQKQGAGVIDIDGNQYATVIIGTQEWMSENLRVSKYNNGDTIVLASSMSDWYDNFSGAFCWPDSNSLNDSIYGKLYNGYTIWNPNKLCPHGWRVPSDSDFSTLINYVDSFSDSTSTIESLIAGGVMKDTGTLYWKSPNTRATNSTGFSIRGSGIRKVVINYRYYFNRNAFFWTSTGDIGSGLAVSRGVEYNSTSSIRSQMRFDAGLSVRCIKGDPTIGLLEKNERKDLWLHPNPTSTLLIVKVRFNTNFQIVDIGGRSIQKGILVKGKNQIDVQALKAGIYIFWIEQNGVLRSTKLIKE